MPPGAAAAVPPMSDDRVRALATEILLRPEYARWRGQSLAWLERLRTWLERFLSWSNNLAVHAPVLYWTLLVLLLGLAVGLLLHVAVSLRAALAQPAAGVSPRADADDPRFLEHAEVLAQKGRFLDAARTVQLAAIDLLIRRRVLTLARADANRVLRRRLGAAALPGSERGELLLLLERLERCWFRDRAEDHELYERWRQLYGRLHALPEGA